VSGWKLWCAHAVLIGVSAACAQSAKAKPSSQPSDEVPLQGTVVDSELAEVIVHLVDSESNQRVETTRRIYRLFEGGDALLATVGDRETLILRLETGRPHRVRAEAQGFEASKPTSVEVPAGTARDEITIMVEPYEAPNSTVVMQVATEGGLPVDGVRIELRAVGDPSAYTYGKTENPGSKVQIDVPADRYWCRVSSPDDAPAWPTQLFELNLGGGDAHVQDVVAADGGTVRVRLPRGHRKLHVKFSVRPVPDNRTYAMYERRGVPADWRGEFRVVSDSLRIAALAPGTYTIGVIANAGGRRWEQTAAVTAGETVELDFTEPLNEFLNQLRRELGAQKR